ncbi:MAG: AtpZ/AtpI family protein [bacterium]|nr:AtpZ/AtpI family protein [bacterium]
MSFLFSIAKRTRRQIRKQSGRGTGVLSLSHLGVTFAASIALYTLAGLWLDKKLGVLPLFTLLGAAVGTVGGFLWLYREVLRAEERNIEGSDDNEVGEEQVES